MKPQMINWGAQKKQALAAKPTTKKKGEKRAKEQGRVG